MRDDHAPSEPNGRGMDLQAFLYANGELSESEAAAFERRLSQEVTHPQFGYRIAYRRLFELQARLLARHLLGEPHVERVQGEALAALAPAGDAAA